MIEGKAIPAHKVFLFAQCEMLSAMFVEGHFRESGRQLVGAATYIYDIVTDQF